MYFPWHITNSGGMERIVIDKINYMSEKGHDVSLVYFGSDDDVPFFPLDKRVKRIALPDNADLTSFYLRVKHWIKTIKAIKTIIANENPDIIVNAQTPIVHWILPFVRKDIPKIFEFHFSYQGLKIADKKAFAKNRYKAYKKDFIRKVFCPLYTKCVVLTEKDKEAWGFKNMVVIPNFTALPIKHRAEMCCQRVISAGRLCYQKDQQILIDAWAIVNRQCGAWQLDIWGNGAEREALEHKIEKLGLEGKVNLKGVSQNIEDKYPNYSLFVLPSRYEGFPLVLVEAMQFGLPCIGFDIPGNDAIIEDGRNGHIVKERSAEALAETIISTIINSDKMKRMSEYAITSVQRFDKDRVMGMWIELFNDVLCSEAV